MFYGLPRPGLGRVAQVDSGAVSQRMSKSQHGVDEVLRCHRGAPEQSLLPRLHRRREPVVLAPELPRVIARKSRGQG